MIAELLNIDIEYIQLSVKMVDISVLGGMLIDVFSIGLRENN